jgi:hypothetical protein
LQRKADNFLAIDILQKGEGAKKLKEKRPQFKRDKIEHSSKHNPKHKMIWIKSYPSKGPTARGFLGFHKETKVQTPWPGKIKTLRGPTIAN